MPHKNRERKNEYSREWKKANKEKVSAYNKKYKQEHKDEVVAYYLEYEKKYKTRRKELYLEYQAKFFSIYGDTCACCGEHRKEFLTVEHKKGKTKKEKTQMGKAMYKALTDNYRPDLYETLCMNCNFSKGKYGYCPHQGEN